MTLSRFALALFAMLFFSSCATRQTMAPQQPSIKIDHEEIVTKTVAYLSKKRLDRKTQTAIVDIAESERGWTVVGWCDKGQFIMNFDKSGQVKRFKTN